MDEVWKEIPDTKGYYLASNLGNVYSTRKRQNITKQVHRNGYVSVWLGIDGKVKTPSLHSLVARAFVDNPEHKPYVNHKDGDKQNNGDDNLEWVTSSENRVHAGKMGLQGYFSPRIKHKLYYEDVCMIFNTLKELKDFLNIGLDRIKYTKKHQTVIGIGDYALYKIKSVYDESSTTIENTHKKRK